MATNKRQAVGNSARVKLLYVGTEQGHAGVLTKESQHLFSYAPETLQGPHPERAISLTMPLRAEPWRRTPMLPAFQTFLPEGFLKERIVERFSKTMRVDDMALLALSGANPIGRLRLSANPQGEPVSGMRESLAEILAHEGTRDLFEYLCDRYLISSGIAGVQPKVLVTADAPAASEHRNAGGADGGDHCDHGNNALAADPKSSFGEKSSLRARQLIVKVAGDDFPDLPVNEYHCMSIARACGGDLIEVPEFWLSEDRRRLVIERFDLERDGGRYLGFEDMVSLQGKANDEKYQGSYENVARAVALNCAPDRAADSLRRLFALVALSVILRNGDAHLKNFGLLYTDPASDDARLAPAYDLVTTTTYIAADKLALKLAGGKSWPGRATLEQFGRDACNVRHAGAIIDRLLDAAMQYRAPENDPTWRAQREVIERAAATLA